MVQCEILKISLLALILGFKQCGQQGRRSKIKDAIACVFDLMIYNFDHKFPDTHLNAMCSCCLVGNCPAPVRNGIKILQFIIFLALSHGVVVWMEFEVLGTRSTKYHEMLGSTQWCFFFLFLSGPLFYWNFLGPIVLCFFLKNSATDLFCNSLKLSDYGQQK